MSLPPFRQLSRDRVRAVDGPLMLSALLYAISASRPSPSHRCGRPASGYNCEPAAYVIRLEPTFRQPIAYSRNLGTIPQTPAVDILRPQSGFVAPRTLQQPQDRAGDQLREMASRGERETGGRPEKRSPAATVSTLQDLGIIKTPSSRWQKLADMPVDQFDAQAAQSKHQHTDASNTGNRDRLTSRRTFGGSGGWRGPDHGPRGPGPPPGPPPHLAKRVMKRAQQPQVSGVLRDPVNRSADPSAGQLP
jgi:hypothetical protein